jgi:hypothetical protein
VVAGVHDEPVGHEQEIELAALGLPAISWMTDRSLLLVAAPS